MRRALPTAWLAVVLAATSAVYWPGLGGPFLFDDRTNFLDVPAIAIESIDIASLRDASFVRGGAYPDRGLARVSFALGYHFAGGEFDAFAFKLANLVVHLVAGVFVYALAVRLMRRLAPSPRAEHVALFAAALWLLHPIQLTNVLYVVQRMNSLAATFVFAGLLAFVVGRERLEKGRRLATTWMTAGVLGGGGLGFLCKENAALIPFLALLLEWFFFERRSLARDARRRLVVFHTLFVGLPVLAAFAGAWFAWDAITLGYVGREFTAAERLLTETRVLWFYVALLVAPYARWFGLFHDDVATSTGWLEPWTTLPSAIGWAAIAIVALWGARRRAPWSFAALWFLAGHVMESTVIALEPVFEHRNYVPSFGVLLAIAYYVTLALSRLPKRTAGAALAAIVAALALTTASRANAWSDAGTLLEVGVRNHPGSSRYNGEYAALLASRGPDSADVYRHWQRAAALDPGDVLALVAMSKILVAHAIAIRSGALPDAPAPGRAPDDPPDALSAPLHANAAYLEALAADADRAIAKRLRERALTPSSVDALAGLASCAASGPAPCVALVPRLESWLGIALDNDRSRVAHRAILMLQLARVLEMKRDPRGADEWLERAIAIDPRELQFRIELVRLRLANDDSRGAALALRAAREVSGPLGPRAGELQALGEAIEAARD